MTDAGINPNQPQVFEGSLTSFTEMLRSKWGIAELEAPGAKDTPADFAAKLLAWSHRLDLICVAAFAGKSVIGMEQISQLQEFAQKRPARSPQSFGVILHAEQLRSDTQNKLLKLLEEPPQYFQFLIHTANSRTLLRTVRSRVSISQLAPDLTTTEVLSETGEALSHVASLFWQGDPSSAIRELDALVQKQKDNPKRQGLLREFTKIVNSQLDLLRLNPEQQQSYLRWYEFMIKATRSNVNAKLSLARTFADWKALGIV